jgi:hypothetical protein
LFIDSQKTNLKFINHSKQVFVFDFTYF